MHRTGKTFRELLDGLKLASEGKHVIYQCPNMDSAHWTCEKALRIVSDFMEPERRGKLGIKIGEGTIQFVRRLTRKEIQSLSRHHFEFKHDY